MTRIVCLTGAESSGKTTLAEALAEALEGVLVREVARELLVPGEAYDEEDVIRIAHHQVDAENRALASTTGWVIADTDLKVIRIWMAERFGNWPAALAQRFAERPPRRYVLCAPDIPWQADPLREHPADADRVRLHALYQTLLAELDASWLEVSGGVETRLQAVLDWLPRQAR